MESTEDLELGAVPTAHLANDIVETLSWQDLKVLVKDRKTGAPLPILSESTGLVRAGEMLAIMGPSGSGKTTLLNALAHRVAAAGAETSGQILANGQRATVSMVRDLSAYVEQEDALIGSITVRESVTFAARLALPRYVNAP
ncbi:ATP-binding cassette domain-containing protein [Candidatus Bathyarchaeota archaeon]|nr:ATP-binding cassette domain-containing protein [Candidatus Bathyarchaeota archaeon]